MLETGAKQDLLQPFGYFRPVPQRLLLDIDVAGSAKFRNGLRQGLGHHQQVLGFWLLCAFAQPAVGRHPLLPSGSAWASRFEPGFMSLDRILQSLF